MLKFVAVIIIYMMLLCSYFVFIDTSLSLSKHVDMFFVSQNIHIKRSPNGVKTDGDFFGIYMIFGKKNPRETVPKVATRQEGAPAPQARP